MEPKDHLRRAINAELTHGGIIDRIAQETSVIGGYTTFSDDFAGENRERIRAAAGRLDDARNAFIDRMMAALKADAEQPYVYRVGTLDQGDTEPEYEDADDLAQAERTLNYLRNCCSPPYDEVWIERAPAHAWERV